MYNKYIIHNVYIIQYTIIHKIYIIYNTEIDRKVETGLTNNIHLSNLVVENGYEYWFNQFLLLTCVWFS